jgi:hypothetical protein
METGCFNHGDEGRFTGAYYYDIERIAPFMENAGFETLRLIGSESVAGGMSAAQWNYWRTQGEEAYWEIMEIIFEMAVNPAILGMSSHLLYIGRKV